MFRLRDYGIQSDVAIASLAGVCAVLAILVIVLLVKMSTLNKKYRIRSEFDAHLRDRNNYNISYNGCLFLFN